MMPDPAASSLTVWGTRNLAGLRYRANANACEHRDAAHGLIVITDLSGVYADLHRHPDSPHGITNRAPAADGGGRTVKDGEYLFPDQIHLFPAVPGEVLADERGVPCSQFEPAAIAHRDESFSRASHVDEEHRRQYPSRRKAWAQAPERIQRLEGREVGRQVRDGEQAHDWHAQKLLLLVGEPQHPAQHGQLAGLAGRCSIQLSYGRVRTYDTPQVTDGVDSKLPPNSYRVRPATIGALGLKPRVKHAAGAPLPAAS